MNSEYYRQKAKERREKYPEKIKAYKRLHRNTPWGIFSCIKARARKDKIEVGFENKTSFEYWYLRQEQKCFYCGRSPGKIKVEGNNVQRLTIDRLDNEKGYSKENCVLACYQCNRIKSNYFTATEMLRVGQIIKEKTD